MDEDILILTKKNETFLHIDTSLGIEQELSEHFAFYVPGYKFTPKYRSRMWDGKIRLFSKINKCIYLGLIDKVLQFAQKRAYPVFNSIISKKEFSDQNFEEFLQSIQLDRTRFKDREYQKNAFLYAIRNKRMLLLSPVASGKSMIIYLICRYLVENNLCKRILIIVPTVALVEQMTKDFIDYGWSGDFIHKIYAGKDKRTNRPITISTWQSLYRLESSYFHQFQGVIGDEAHEQKSTQTKGILERLINASYRIGTTATIAEGKTHKMVLEGLFGNIVQYVKTKELMDIGDLSPLKIKALLLRHTPITLKMNWTYQEEINFLIAHKPRNDYIRNLALSLKGNTLILYTRIDAHGEILYKMINKDRSNRNVYYIHGGTHIDDREKIREVLEKEKDAILIASTGTFSRGSNIKNLKNIIFAHPSKDKIRVMQSIGRGLRLHDEKEFATLYDLADDTRFSLKHFLIRHKLYKTEKFDCKTYQIHLKG